MTHGDVAEACNTISITCRAILIACSDSSLLKKGGVVAYGDNVTPYNTISITCRDIVIACSDTFLIYQTPRVKNKKGACKPLSSYNWYFNYFVFSSTHFLAFTNASIHGDTSSCLRSSG